ncbi:heterodisulfide reductase-related iron-sulfur binding cluster [Desertibaculum subflavum]|uniref:heterodisulfide reductase-related iron-sulfur binding cluster n=1 Tax=Desertibaculum subflavum TaxID=2268458 RepID=UPI000E66AE0E
MREGSLDAPMRHPLAWNDPDFYDEAKLDAELRRVFDICHGCRRCFNLCDSFPRLFDLVDASPTEELDGVKSEDFKQVVDACTLCDMCFLTKCPYVPPHEFNLDFPHLMLRYRAVEMKKGKVSWTERELSKTDRNGRLAGAVAPLANWASDEKNRLTRPILEKTVGIDARAHLPKFHGRTFVARAKDAGGPAADGPAKGAKAVLYATCFVNYNSPGIGEAALKVLHKQGVETKVVHPTCCGMPKLEHGDIADVAARAKKVAAELLPLVDQGYDVVALVPSCALMLKFEWPLILPGDPDIKRLAQATQDLSEYVVGLGKRYGLAPGMQPLEGGVSLHLACHARAQNMGAKGAEMLRLVPSPDIAVIERCSGHGGSWGVMKENFQTAIKVGKPVARQAAKGKAHLASECPLAADHIVQGIGMLGDGGAPQRSWHPIELMAKAYGLLP